MGIPRFYGEWLRVRFGDAIRHQKPGGVSSLAIDLNGMIHQAASKAFGYYEGVTKDEIKLLRQKSYVSLEANFHIMFRGLLMSVIQSIAPQDVLILAVDGVAPQAKIAQQRQRRYKAGLRQWGDPRNPPIFDTNQVTPGTTFMRNLDVDLRLFLEQQKAVLPPKIFYSSHMVPGEGEHKIMDYYRNGDVWGETAALGGAHILYGLDADLIMLSLLSPQPNIVLTREDINTYIYIDILRKQLREHMGSETGIDDFVLIMFLLGNDFLPAQPAFYNMQESIDFLIDRYKTIGQPLTTHTPVPVTTTGLTVTDSKIHWPAVLALLKEVGQYEPQLLSDSTQKSYKYPSTLLARAVETGIFEYNVFRQLWYEYEIGYFGTPETVALVEAILNQVGQTLDSPTMSPERLQTMIEEYFRTWNWVYLYYKEGLGSVDQDFQYSYYHAPLLLDLGGMVMDEMARVTIPYAHPDMIVYTPLHQLIAVIPPPSIDIIPPEIRYLYKVQSPIRDLLPNVFVLLREGVNDDGHAIALLPIATRSRISQAIQGLGLSRATTNNWMPANEEIMTTPREQLMMYRKSLQALRSGQRAPTVSRGTFTPATYAPASKVTSLSARLAPTLPVPKGPVQLPVYTSQVSTSSRPTPGPSTQRAPGTQRGRGGTRERRGRGRGQRQERRVGWEQQGNLM